MPAAESSPGVAADAPAGDGGRLLIVPTYRDEVHAFIRRLHRHHPRPTGFFFLLAVANEAGEVVGVATAGRPSAHPLQDGWTFEVTRSCTDGYPNANSCLYGAAWRTGRALGYRRGVTYTQDGESGASLKAAGWLPAAQLAPRPGWDTPSRPRDESQHPTEVGRTRWEITATAPPWAVRPRVFVEAAESDLMLFEEAS